MKKISAGTKLVLYAVVMIMAAGCGLKANPVPSSSGANGDGAEPKFSLQAMDGAIVLAWSATGENVSYVNVEKSELGTTGNICRNCPRAYTGIAGLTLKNERRFVDRAVEKGKSYSYRLNFCTEAGNCRPSQSVEIDLK